MNQYRKINDSAKDKELRTLRILYIASSASLCISRGFNNLLKENHLFKKASERFKVAGNNDKNVPIIRVKKDSGMAILLRIKGSNGLNCKTAKAKAANKEKEPKILCLL